MSYLIISYKKALTWGLFEYLLVAIIVDPEAKVEFRGDKITLKSILLNKFSRVFFSLQDVSQIQLGLSRPNEKRHSDLLNAMSARLTDAIYRDFLRKERRKMLSS